MADPNSVGTLYVLRGVVGCGKTTYAMELERLARLDGRQCSVEGTDKFIFKGMSIKQAHVALANALRQAQRSTRANKILILETCSATFNRCNVVGVDFSSWRVIEVWVNFDRDKLNQYLAWTLRNVLQRSNALVSLSRASLPICVGTHLTKARAYFGSIQPLVPDNCPLHIVLKTLQPQADEYEKYLDDNAERFCVKLQ